MNRSTRCLAVCLLSGLMLGLACPGWAQNPPPMGSQVPSRFILPPKFAPVVEQTTAVRRVESPPASSTIVSDVRPVSLEVDALTPLPEPVVIDPPDPLPVESDVEGNDVKDNCPADGACGSAYGGILHRMQHSWIGSPFARLIAKHRSLLPQTDNLPFGSQVAAYMGTHIANGAADRLVLYQYDFEDPMDGAGVTLNPRGERELTVMAERMVAVNQPLMIEASGNTQRDQLRRLHVVGRLQATGHAFPDEMVIVGQPLATGLLEGAPNGGYTEPELNFQHLLEHASQRGRTPIGGTAGGAP